MTRIVLVRHGHVEGISPERFRGRTEIPLSELGRRQAALTAAAVAARWRFEAVYTSPMGRCVETGQAIASERGMDGRPLVELHDLDYGEWQWRTFEDVRATSPGLFERWFAAPDLVRFPGGDSLANLVARTADALRFVTERHPAETIVLVGHDSVNRAILIQALAQPLSAYWRLAQSPCGINEIEIEGDRIQVLRVNETAHLESSPI
jgi:broad specificity phosphatase PhoE